MSEMIMAFNTIAKIVILVSIFLVVAINVISVNAYNFVRCEGDTNTYPQGTECESDADIVREESEDYQEYKEKTKWWDEEDDEQEHEEESREWNNKDDDS